MSSEQEAVASLPDSTMLSLHNDAEGNEIIFPHTSQRQLAILDIKDGSQKWRLWLMLAYQDIKLRYRRSVLGPFWLTLSMAITVYTMGFLYSRLFHIELAKYFPLICAGMLSWSLISTIMLEFTDGLAATDGLLKEIKLPYTLYCHRIAARNFIIFMHNIVVIIPILAIYHEYAQVNWHTLLLIPGLLFIYLNALSFGMILAIIGARYRDVSQIIKSLIQVIFFVTPVLWSADTLEPSIRFVVYLNPFASFLEIIRSPMLGHVPSLFNYATVVIISIVNLLISFELFARYRSRIIYWI